MIQAKFAVLKVDDGVTVISAYDDMPELSWAVYKDVEITFLDNGHLQLKGTRIQTQKSMFHTKYDDLHLVEDEFIKTKQIGFWKWKKTIQYVPKGEFYIEKKPGVKLDMTVHNFRLLRYSRAVD
jgi:hypothetical protein